MDVKLSDDQVALQQSFSRLLERNSPMSSVRDAEPLGFSPTLWAEVAGVGGITMGISEEFGGEGATLVDLAIVAEQMGRALASIPFAEAVVGARLAETFVSQIGSEQWESLKSGSTIATIALRPFIEGRCLLVPAGAVADMAFGIDGDRLVAVNGSRARIEPRPANLGSMPLQDLILADDALVLAEGSIASDAMEMALDEWRVLTAAALVGLASKAHEIALAYVEERELFGAKLGAFQTVAHRLADDVVQIDGCRLLVHEAAWTADVDLSSSSTFACASFAYAADTAMRVATDCLHFHGGSGYTMEQDAQMYFRRAKSWALVFGDSRHEYLAVADRLWGEGVDH